MSLLDGKYEVIAQRPLEGGRTLFDAIAPDGTPLRIEWFELPPGEEAAFERYRRVLRTLKRDDLAALHDVVSRPGARYVAWLKPDPGTQPASDAAIAAVLQQHAFAPEAADVRRLPRKPPRLYGLAFDGLSVPMDVTTEAEPEPAKPLRGGSGRTTLLERVPQSTLSWGLAAVLFLTAALLAMGAFQRRVVDQLVVVPDLIGTDVNDAIKALTALQLAVDVTPLASTEVAGRVLAVEPSAGSELRPNRLVRISYALPAGQLAQTEVPALVGLTYPDEVNAALTAAGLTLGDVARINAAAPGGVVLAQHVSAGERVGNGASVSVLLSAGRAHELTFIPRLVGLDVDEAIALATVAGIAPDRVFVDRVTAASGAAGTVLSQSLTPHVPVPRDDAILRLVVQTGTPIAAAGGAPDLVGLTLDEAHLAASSSQGTWRLVVERMATVNLPAGIVVMQSPRPGERVEDVATGSELVTVTVNVHPVALRDPGVRVIVREPQARLVEYAWAIQPGIGQRVGEVWATSLDGTRTLVARPTVVGGEILRGSWRTQDPGPIRFELLLGGIPYGGPLLVP